MDFARSFFRVSMSNPMASAVLSMKRRFSHGPMSKWNTTHRRGAAHRKPCRCPSVCLSAQKVNRVAVRLHQFRALHMLKPKAAKDLKVGHHQGRRSCSVVLGGMRNCFQHLPTGPTTLLAQQWVLAEHQHHVAPSPPWSAPRTAKGPMARAGCCASIAWLGGHGKEPSTPGKIDSCC